MPTSTNELMEAIKLRLELVMPGQADTYGLPQPLKYYRHMPNLAVIVDTPYIWATPQNIVPGGPAQFGVGGAQMQTRLRNILIGCDVAGQDGDEAQERVEAFGDLLIVVMESDQTMRATAHRVRFMGLEYNSAFGAGTQLFARVLGRFEFTRWAAMGAD